MTTPSCGLIFGGDQHVDNKSHDYTVVRLDHDKGQAWHPLSPSSVKTTPENGSSGGSPEDTGDVAFEHRSTGAIISVDSTCNEYRDSSLEELSHYLLLGLKTEGPVVSQPAHLDGEPALESTVDASMSQRAPSNQSSNQPDRFDETPVRVRAVVVRKGNCTYDLMFVARPQSFDELSPTFERFLKGFHVK